MSVRKKTLICLGALMLIIAGLVGGAIHLASEQADSADEAGGPTHVSNTGKVVRNGKG